MSSWLERIESFHLPVNDRVKKEKKPSRLRRLIKKMQDNQLARVKIIVKENRFHW